MVPAEVTSLVGAAATSAPMGLALFDLDGRVRWVNDWLAGVLGIDPDAAVGRTVGEVVPHLAGDVDPHVRKVLTTGEPVTGLRLATLAATDRQRHLGTGSFLPVHGPDGALEAVATMWWRIDDPAPAEQARREVEGRFRAMADAAPMFIWTADETGACDWFNAGWLAFTGQRLEDELGDGWADGVHPDDLERCLGVYRDAVARREPFEMEYRVRRHDGAYRWLLDRAVPRFTPDGSFTGFVGSCLDIEDRRAAAAAERAARLDAERLADRLGRLQGVTAAFAEALSERGVYDAVIAEAVAASGADAGSVCLVDTTGRAADVARAVGYDPAVLERFTSFPLDADLPLAVAIRTGEAVFIGSVDETPGYDDFKEVAEPAGHRAAASLPLVVDGRTTGGIGLSFDEPQPFDDAQRAFLAALARQCAAALERVRLLEAQQAAHARLVFLAEASEIIASTLDRVEVLRRVGLLAVPRLADRVAAYLPVGGELERVVLVPAEPDAVPAIAAAVSVDVESDVPVAACFRTAAPSATGGLVVPITMRGVTLGVLAFARSDPHALAEAEDIAVAVELGARVGVALENAGLYEREHSVAEALQRAVLPDRLPVVEGVELAARYHPAGPGVDIGGDWYDAFVLRDGRLGIAIGDVAGHGMRAAATMGQLRNALRAYALDGDPPATVLSRLSRLLADEGDEAFTTAIYAVYELDSGRLRWADAGHPPALRLGDGAFLEEPIGPVLGVDTAGFGEGEVTLVPGDGVLLYTDGLVERRGAHLDEGMGELSAAVVAARGASVEALCDDVVARVLGEAIREDDVCLLAVRRRA